MIFLNKKCKFCSIVWATVIMLLAIYIFVKFLNFCTSNNSNTETNIQETYETSKINYLSAISHQKGVIEKEWRDFFTEDRPNRKLDDLIIEQGGHPIRNIIVTTWRSGSSFMGGVISSHPGTFYTFEPLQHLGDIQIRNGKLAKEGLRVINNILSCNFAELEDYMRNLKFMPWLLSHNTRVWESCKKANDENICFDAEWMSSMCKIFPIQTIKTVRFRLRQAKAFLENQEFDARILFLVRDPRGTMRSRVDCAFCIYPDCIDASRLCMDLEDDFREAEVLRELYPERFLAIRYEDFTFSPVEGTKKILDFFRLQYHPDVVQFLNNHTTQSSQQRFGHIRDLKTFSPFHWTEDYKGNFSQVTNIQNTCTDAMQQWGYTPVKNENDLGNFNPLGSPPWNEMLILGRDAGQFNLSKNKTIIV